MVTALKPYLILACAVTIDGRIASITRYSKLSCPYDLKRLHELRANVDAVMVGANTVITDNPELTVRYVKGKNPLRVVIDGRLRIPLNAKILNTTKAKTLVITSRKAPLSMIEKLKSKNVIVWMVNGEVIDLKEVLEKLYVELNIRKVLVEGGGTLNWYLIKQDLIDEMRITVTPYIFGAGISVFQGEGFKTVHECPKFKLTNIALCECGNEVILKYVRVR
ncbi:MAG: 2,5-diamino-6-(ribosylamino)-4(3H)-pyrimidinone 5'-phosphate reductase [Thermoprotei archaeon ex4572_64]|nr:MAG: 2,5-diamino-6-(ribosylamino)-4(3H)-pyrimidinone 5'-phosphate reductase [Thermoprotei archaeon ex4572_64]